MNIDTYKDLKEAVALWLNRKDSATIDNIPMFINFAEKQFTRLVKLPYYEVKSEFTIDENFDYVVIPQDFLSAKHMMVNGKPYNRVDVETFMRMKNLNNTRDYVTSKNDPDSGVILSDQAGSTSDKAYFFTRIGEQIHFLPTPKVGDVVELIYRQDIPEMQFDNDQPYSLLVAPDVMLYLAMRHASIFIRDVEMEQYWMSKAQEAAESLQTQIDEAEWSGSAFVVPYFDH
ncbi:hypothetical protein GAP52_015 [Cronobacter phage vB_CsaP_GAP52]|uniref:Uncharacterized protein n=1 Tax=Cronobacter phage vB_CsaP_GAP52 TaxID=1141137 RepID=K4F7V8_9CAUD|nr:virion structural protein [Cronobacter phage vB_CsaP_GAP52]AFC22007.1 hypothetical protein GAP52_015 [Cronobacter phage vB_CsaP_GAP52]